MTHPVDPNAGSSQLFNTPPWSQAAPGPGALSGMAEEEAKREAEQQGGNSAVDNAVSVADAAASGALGAVGDAAAAVVEGAASLLGGVASVFNIFDT